MPTIHDNPKDAAEAYIAHLQRDYYKWYKDSVNHTYRFWICCQVFALVAGFGTSVLAALLSQKLISGPFIAGIVVVLPFAGSVASTVLIQARVYDRWRLRENGRIGFQSLVTDGRRRFAAATSSAEYTTLHKELSDAAEKLENDQSKSFFALSPRLAK
jgi:hypothetical protein